MRIYAELMKKKSKMDPIQKKKHINLSEKFTAILNDSSASQADIKKLTDLNQQDKSECYLTLDDFQTINFEG